MNTGWTITFIIGGLLLISIIAMNSRVIENSGDTVLNMSAKQTVETVTQVMSRDFLRIGYNTGDEPSEAIQFVSDNKIVFEADLNNDNVESPVKITWEVRSNKKIKSTTNPDDFELIRKVDSGPEKGTTTFAVTDCSFTYLNNAGSPTTDTKTIKSIKVSMVSEAPDKYGDQPEYEKSIWNKTFTPPNLNFQAYNSGDSGS